MQFMAADSDEQHTLQDTQRGSLRRLVPRGTQDACLVHIYPSGPDMGRRYPLGGRVVTLGRGEGCDVRIPDQSVSRNHARIDCALEGYDLADLQSTNGTFVNDQPVGTHRLNDGDYVRVGNCIYRFLAGGNVEADYHEEIYRLTIMDALTETHNKRSLFQFLDHELARSERHQRPLALVMFDIDHFKALNDRLGHLAGDATLRELAAAVRTHVRKVDLFARYGGEEFALVLPETTHDGAMACAEQVRSLVANHPFQFEGEAYQVTVSLGVAATVGEASLTPATFIAQADANLYKAKHAGRNRVVG
ncbi:MAG TPA: GGDEF domain-containing protein [Gemmataceae bacterium]|jgi:diguanylate cyclase (GGDEF)-like protein